jgi:hypothetical protein
VFLHAFDSETSEGAHVHGIEETVWRPVVAMPLFTGRKLEKAKCGCGMVFDNEQAYKEHFVYYAVWENESDYIPQQIRQGIRAALTTRQETKES